MNRTHVSILALAFCACGDPSDAPSEEPAELQKTGAIEGESVTDEADLTEAGASDDTTAEDAAYAAAIFRPRFTRYVALGDSFSSGNGASNTGGSWFSAPCFRKTGAWPVLLSKRLNVSRFDHLACSGNTGPVVIAEQLPQLQGADQNTLITITVGGNDSRFPEFMGRCVTKDCSTKEEKQAVKDGLGTAFANMVELFPKLRAMAPRSTIVAVGYPHYVDEAACGWSISKEEATLIHSGIDQMNSIIEGLALLNGISAITGEVVQKFSQHGLCGNPPGISVLTLPPEASYHPNDLGNRAYADAVEQGLLRIP